MRIRTYRLNIYNIFDDNTQNAGTAPIREERNVSEDAWEESNEGEEDNRTQRRA